jgi:glycosyltransferase involved in cell wall biosynthesis
MAIITFPRISIVTVCYNHVAYLEDCIRSVLNQDYPNLEYIVIDGGSTDGSADIIRNYRDRLVYWVSEPDKGQTDALIKGFRHATGDIEGWINSDDMLVPGALMGIAEFFQRYPDARVVTGDHYKMDESGKIIYLHREIPFNRFIWYHTYNYLAQTSTFWKRDLYEEVGGLNPRYNIGMDTDLIIRFADRTYMHKTRAVWSRFRLHSGQKCQTLLMQGETEQRDICSRYVRVSPEWYWRTKGAIARLWRVGWRLFAGCYPAQIPRAAYAWREARRSKIAG